MVYQRSLPLNNDTHVRKTCIRKKSVSKVGRFAHVAWPRVSWLFGFNAALDGNGSHLPALSSRLVGKMTTTGSTAEPD